MNGDVFDKLDGLLASLRKLNEAADELLESLDCEAAE